MRLYISGSLVLLLIASSLVASASAEVVYANRREAVGPYYSTLEGYNSSDASLRLAFDTSSVVAGSTTYSEGIALSPNGSILYMAAYRNLYSFDVATGNQLGSVTVSSGSKDALRGVAVDSNGDIYVSVYTNQTGANYRKGWINKVSSDFGTVTVEWGAGTAVTNSRLTDLEVYNGVLYAGGQDTNSMGVYGWDLSTGGASTVLGGTSGNRVDGLTFDADGTLYTCNYYGTIEKWSTDYSTDTTIVDFGERVVCDIEYSEDGYLYATRYLSDRSPIPGELTRIDLSDNSYVKWVDYGTTGSMTGRFIAIGEAVPEPSMLALLTTGLIGLLAYAWRRRK